MRRNLEHLIEMLSALGLDLPSRPRLQSREKAAALKAAGLKRVTVSLDRSTTRIFSA